MQLKQGRDDQMPLTASPMKPLHTTWLIEVWRFLSVMLGIPDLAFDRTGVVQAFAPE